MVEKDPFMEYIRQSEPSKREKGYSWHTAIGLQAVDGLKPSKYLIETAIQNIEGNITIDEVGERLNSYYQENSARDSEDRTEEADKVSVRIAKILSEKAFSFTPNEYISTHKKLFNGIYSQAGKIRTYNITKNEWVLNGATVLYGSASELRATLDYDFSVEKKFSYKDLSIGEVIHHLSIFVSRLWQIHIFEEGNTRTTAVFFIKYLRTLGFDATNDTFATNAWYFRNALVRANFNDLKNGIHETTEYLELFLKNLLLNESNGLHNRAMHIKGMYVNTEKADIRIGKAYIKEERADIGERKADIEEVKTDIGEAKADIGEAKADIEEGKADIEEKIKTLMPELSQKTLGSMIQMYESYGDYVIFGRSSVEELTGLKSTRVSELLRLMLDAEMIQGVKGYGKGKYRFIKL